MDGDGTCPVCAWSITCWESVISTLSWLPLFDLSVSWFSLSFSGENFSLQLPVSYNGFSGTERWLSCECVPFHALGLRPSSIWWCLFYFGGLIFSPYRFFLLLWEHLSIYLWLVTGLFQGRWHWTLSRSYPSSIASHRYLSIYVLGPANDFSLPSVP